MAPATGAITPDVTSPMNTVADDWTTYAHDYERTGHQLQPTGISKTNVGGLQLLWSKALPDEIESSPLVSAGLVIVAGQNTGIVFALSSKTGQIVWQTQLSAPAQSIIQLRSTGSIADGQLFIGTHDFAVDAGGNYIAAPSNLYDLDLTTGVVRWSIPVNGTIRGTPVVADGRVFYDVAGGDLPSCFQGGVFAADEASGAPVWGWQVEPIAGVGGSVWAPLTYDGTTLYVGTGNTCGPVISTANGFVALSASTGKLAWSLVAQANSFSDDDTGGGAVLLNGTLYFISKNGVFYAVNRVNGALTASTRLNPTDFNGGFATATTDGSTILVGDGELAASSTDSKRFYTVHRERSTKSVGSHLVALDPGLNVKWRVNAQGPISSYAAIANGLVFAPLDASITVLDIASGAQLWTYPTNEIVEAGPAVVPSGVYAADTGGTVYAFGLVGKRDPTKR